MKKLSQSLIHYLQQHHLNNVAYLNLQQTSHMLQNCKQKLKDLYAQSKIPKEVQENIFLNNLNNNLTIETINLPMMCIELYASPKIHTHLNCHVQNKPQSINKCIEHHLFVSPNSIIASHLLGAYQPNLNAQQNVYIMGEFSEFCFKQCFASFFKADFSDVVLHVQQEGQTHPKNSSPTEQLIVYFQDFFKQKEYYFGQKISFKIYTGQYQNPTQATKLITVLKNMHPNQAIFGLNEYHLYDVAFSWTDKTSATLLHSYQNHDALIVDLTSSAQANFFIERYLQFEKNEINMPNRPIICTSKQHKVLEICRRANLKHFICILS
jgi:hypothetical protein